MNPEYRRKLADRVAKAAAAALAARKYVSPIDVLVGIGWLDPGAVKRWRQGQVDYLERALATNLPRITEAMKLFRSWAAGKGLVPSEIELSVAVAAAPDAAFQQERKPDDRAAVSHPLGFGGAFREEARALGAEGEPGRPSWWWFSR